ncbi:MAG: hypothetical protein R2857_10865 [Vampirovibrionales bacterium]
MPNGNLVPTHLFESYAFPSGDVLHFRNGQLVAITPSRPDIILPALVTYARQGFVRRANQLSQLIASGFFSTSAQALADRHNAAVLSASRTNQWVNDALAQAKRMLGDGQMDAA